MLMLSMLDDVQIKIAKIQDQNPLSEIHTVVEVMQVKEHPDIEFEDGNLKQLQEDAIINEISKIYADKPMNARERFIIQLYDGKCTLSVYVEKITGFNHKSSQSYGTIVSNDKNGDSDIICKPGKKNFKIVSNRLNEKQVFKKNMNF